MYHRNSIQQKERDRYVTGGINDLSSIQSIKYPVPTFSFEHERFGFTGRVPTCVMICHTTMMIFNACHGMESQMRYKKYPSGHHCRFPGSMYIRMAMNATRATRQSTAIKATPSILSSGHLLQEYPRAGVYPSLHTEQSGKKTESRWLTVQDFSAGM